MHWCKYCSKIHTVPTYMSTLVLVLKASALSYWGKIAGGNPLTPHPLPMKGYIVYRNYN